MRLLVPIRLVTRHWRTILLAVIIHSYPLLNDVTQAVGDLIEKYNAHCLRWNKLNSRSLDLFEKQLARLKARRLHGENVDRDIAETEKLITLLKLSMKKFPIQKP